LKRFKFEKTPIMSTYLLAFVVGEYDYIEDKDRNGILIRVYTPLGKKEQGQFALDVSKNPIIIDRIWTIRSTINNQTIDCY
jgi:puromycin-sensitive aminopeptidase